MTLAHAQPTSSAAARRFVPDSRENDRGAATLRDSMARNLPHLSKERFLKNVEWWMSAIKGKEKEDPRSLNLYRWYWSEVSSRSYQAPNWRVSPERSALFAQFRSDPYYHLKNLVEVVARGVLEEDLRSDGVDTEVLVTSDSDDVFSGVDYVVVTKGANGSKSYAGVDLAVSEDERYLSEKQNKRPMTVCYEFNAHRGLKNKEDRTKPFEMDRFVYPIKPASMARFLTEFLRLVSEGKQPSLKDAFALFREANAQSLKNTVESVRSKTAQILH